MDYLKEMTNEAFKTPPSDRSIYILLHKHMLFTLNTIELFSNIDLETGENYKSNVESLGYLNKKYDTKNEQGFDSPTYLAHTKISDGAGGGKVAFNTRHEAEGNATRQDVADGEGQHGEPAPQALLITTLPRAWV